MASAAIIVALDPQECALPDLGEVVPWSGVDEFFLVGCEERLGGGVIETGSAASHGTDDAVLGAEVGELVGGVLTAAVAVEDHPGRGAAGDEGGGEGLDDQAG